MIFGAATSRRCASVKLVENEVYWHRAVCIMAILLGCFSGCVGLLGLTAMAADERDVRPAPNQAAITVDRPLHSVSSALMLAHCGALVVFGSLAQRARKRSSRLLQLVFRAGVPVVLLMQVSSLSEQWTLRGLLTGDRSTLASLLLVFGVLWSFAWSALKVGLFVWADRYLGRELESLELS